MDIVYKLTLVLHFLGLGSLLGGWLTQTGARERVVNPAILHGVFTMLVTGVIMVGLAEAVDSLDKDLDNAKIGVKLLVAVTIAVLAVINRKRTAIPDGLYFLIGGLAVTNVVVAVFWT
jgi:hypothetical protein